MGAILRYAKGVGTLTSEERAERARRAARRAWGRDVDLRSVDGETFRRSQREANEAARRRWGPELRHVPPEVFTLAGERGEGLGAFVAALRSWPWFERVGAPHPADRSLRRIGLDEARARPWPPLLSLPGAEAAHDALLEADADERLFEILPAVVSDRVWDWADTVSVRVGWDVAKLASMTLLYASYEVALGPLVRAPYFLRLARWYEDGHWPCAYEGGGRSRRLVLL